MKRKHVLTKEEIEKYFVVDAENGKIYWNVNISKCKIGDECGCDVVVHRNGGYVKKYRVVILNNVRYLRSYIIFSFVYPDILKDSDEIDHENGNSLDDRIVNLRRASHQQNMMNKKIHSNKMSGISRGVRYRPGKSKSHPYLAEISYNGKKIHIGFYGTDKEASDAYWIKRNELYGDFAKINHDGGNI